MKICQACKRDYDDSWEICLNCNKPLKEGKLVKQDRIEKKISKIPEILILSAIVLMVIYIRLLNQMVFKYKVWEWLWGFFISFNFVILGIILLVIVVMVLTIERIRK